MLIILFAAIIIFLSAKSRFNRAHMEGSSTNYGGGCGGGGGGGRGPTLGGRGLGRGRPGGGRGRGARGRGGARAARPEPWRQRAREGRPGGPWESGLGFPGSAAAWPATQRSGLGAAGSRCKPLLSARAVGEGRGECHPKAI